MSADQRFVYTTNNISETISSYRVGFIGSLPLITEIAANTGKAPVDLTITPDSKFRYNVNTLNGTVSAYEISRWDGSLSFIGDFDGLPKTGSAVGVAVYYPGFPLPAHFATGWFARNGHIWGLLFQ